MKKVNLTLALTGLLLASCANDDLVVKPVPLTDSGSQIAFDMNLGNISRSQDLHDAGYTSFGVWAVKAANQDAFLAAGLNLGTYGGEDPSVVMNNYWVKYCTKEHYGSFWSYVPDDWSEDPKVLPDGKTTQYLKYWDGSVENTYFVAYGPAVNGVTFDNGYDSATPTDPTLTFPLCETNTGANNFIYSDITAVTNAEYITGTTDNPKKVQLKFYRLLSQVKIAFWESIPGYTVELNDITFTDASTAGVAAMPAKYNGSAWQTGKIVNKAKPVVSYDRTAADITAHANVSVSYTGAVAEYKMLDFALPSGTIGTSKTGCSYSSTVYNVMPNNASVTYTPAVDPNDGLQFVVNYTIKAEDTNETIDVKGARVFVPKEFTAWAPNTVYTYVFQITKNSSGTTTTDQPVAAPAAPVDALYPIIFDGLTVEDISGGSIEKDFVINQKLSDLYININGGLTAQTLKLQYPDDDVTYKWYSETTTVATVVEAGTGTGSNTSLETTVTPVAVGTTKITVKDPSTAEVASCTVYVYNIDLATALADASASVTIGSTTNLTDPFTTPLSGSWSSSDDAIATVSTAGVVTGVAAGAATITCTCIINGEPKSKKWTVTVTAAP